MNKYFFPFTIFLLALVKGLIVPARKGSNRGVTGGKSMLSGRSKGYRLGSDLGKISKPKKSRKKGF